MTNQDAPMLPGMEPTMPEGTVERSTRQQLDALRKLGYLLDHHEGQAELAIVTARAVDRASNNPRGAASGFANLARALREIFETLPTPEAASKDTLDVLLSALMDNDGVPA